MQRRSFLKAAGSAMAARALPAFAQTCPPSPTPGFWGCNGHLTLGEAYGAVPYATQIAQLKDMGFSLYRNDVVDANGAAQVASFARQAAASAGPKLVITPTLGPNGSNWGGSTETACYNANFALGKAAATALKGLVPAYEIGNEMELACLQGNGDGNLPSDYINGMFSLARGVINGLADGVRSVDMATPLVMNPVSWLHFGFNDMLLSGRSPDGSGGHKIPQFQITAYHWYSDMRDMEAAQGGTGTYNVLQHIAAYGKPIWLTEYGVRPSGSEGAMTSTLTGPLLMADWVRLKATYNIQNVSMYSLYDDSTGAYGAIRSDGVTHKGRYAALKSFIAAHPV